MSVMGGTITSSPGEIPAAIVAACKAAVPLLHAMAKVEPCFFANSAHSAFTFLPEA